MTEKVKFNLEYEFHSSPRILFSFLFEPTALAQWFADDVNVKDNIYEFTWDDETRHAKLISSKENKSVKFKWMDDEDHYFEMEILLHELTNDVALAITDFATEENIEDRKMIWDNQIEYLQQVIGA
jgi:uncharacterized protein YndB with AHSA1/START domain